MDGGTVSAARHPRRVILVNGRYVDADEFKAKCDALRDQGYTDVSFGPNRKERRRSGDKPKLKEPRIFVRTGEDPREKRRARNERKRRRKERG